MMKHVFKNTLLAISVMILSASMLHAQTNMPLPKEPVKKEKANPDHAPAPAAGKTTTTTTVNGRNVKVDSQGVQSLAAPVQEKQKENKQQPVPVSPK